MKKIKIILSLITASIIVSGCSPESGSETEIETSTTNVGQLVDNYISGAEYECNDGSVGITDENGKFECETLPVKFKVSNIVIGEISDIPVDNQVFPQDLVGVDRLDTNNTKVLSIAQFLQSLDIDNNATNGIEIDEEKTKELKTLIGEEEVNFEEEVHNLMDEAHIEIKSIEEVKKHLDDTTKKVKELEDSDLPKNIKDELLTLKTEITTEIKNDLIYMGNEEKLAYDVYTKMYELYPEEKVFENISKKSETKHFEAIKNLIYKYDINITELDDITNNPNLTMVLGEEIELDDLIGEYNLQSISDLYKNLINKGSMTKTDAFEVGCIVEVTDINDLLKRKSNLNENEDIEKVYDYLLNGSYNHYWSFDKALKNNGVVEGCCSLGEEYCHTEYPYKEEKGNKH